MCSVANFIDENLFNSPTPSYTTNCPARLYALNDASILNKYKGEYLNIAVAYSRSPSLYKKVYINGKFFKAVPMYSSSFTGLGSGTAYLGLNYNNSDTNLFGKGLNAQYTAFRIYFGELLKGDAKSLFLIGADPSHVTNSSTDTESDIYFNFYSTSLVELDIQFLGGSSGPTSNSGTNSSSTSFMYNMFGKETSFLLSPTDAQCTYAPIFNLDPETSSTNINKVPAMNYTVTLVKNTLPAPVFSNNSCPTLGIPCYCGESKSPYQYMSDANLLNQSFIVIDINSTVSTFQYYYRTGLCYELIGSEHFSLTEGTANSGGDSCFTSDVFYMNKTDGSSLKTKNVTIKLFERYPEGNNWFSIDNQNNYVMNKWQALPLVNWYIEDSIITINDQISNGNQNMIISYNTTLSKSCDVCYTLVADGMIYQLSANSAFPSFPYDLKFEVQAKRTGSDGTFTVDNIWYIPVLGVVPKEVPNYYPVSSDPNLIFMIIRDPPGGKSQTTIKEGTTIKFGISIDNMVTQDIGTKLHSVAGAGYWETAYAGAFVIDKIIDVRTQIRQSFLNVYKVTNEYGSTSTHDYSFHFESDFSTSADPDIAGHPSDVIIGGGVDIVVGEATQGKYICFLCIRHFWCCC